jgi:pimeloyl-ACP methyl ester carboxylesterase
MRFVRIPLLIALAALALSATSAVAASPSLTAKTRFVKAGHVRLAYRSIGHGRPLVMIMGWGGTMDAWDPAFVDALAKDHRVVIFDNRGVARSSTTGAPLTVHVMGQDTARLIRALHLSRPDVLGWSMGGFIAQDLAVSHPGDVRRLVLCATAAAFPRFIQPSADLVRALFSGNFGAAQLLAVLFPSDQAAAQGAYVARILKWPGFQLIGLAAEAAQGQAVIKWTTQPGNADPRKIRQKALVADGANDQLVVAENARRLAKAIPHARLKLYPDAAHAFLFQDRGPFAKLIERFL